MPQVFVRKAESLHDRVGLFVYSEIGASWFVDLKIHSLIHAWCIVLVSINDETFNIEQAGEILTSDMWNRRISTIVPFIKVFEYDDVRRRIYQGLPDTSDSTTKRHQQDSAVNLLLDTNETQETRWNSGLLAEDAALKECVSTKDLTTAAIAEMSQLFWNTLPKHWHEESDFTWDKITFEVEQCLVKVDASLHAHFGMLVANEQGDFPYSGDSMKHIVKTTVGNFFTGILQ